MSPAAPIISVLMVNWNTRDMTIAALGSLLEHTHRTSLEVILVDNASHDGSVEAIQAKFPQVRVVAESENHGFARGTNLAAALAQGKFFLLLNTDTVILDGAVDKLMEFARRTPEARIWGGKTVFDGGSPNPTSAWRRITAWSSFCISSGLTALGRGSRLLNPEAVTEWGGNREREVDIVSGCFLLIDASLWRELGGFDEAFFMYGEEADLCARARAKGARPMVTPDATIVHHGGASASRRTQTVVYIHRARVELIQRHLTGVSRFAARQFTIMGAFWRAGLYGLLSRVSRGQRGTGAAAQWREVWQRRREWQDGVGPAGH